MSRNCERHCLALFENECVNGGYCGTPPLPTCDAFIQVGFDLGDGWSSDYPLPDPFNVPDPPGCVPAPGTEKEDCQEGTQCSCTEYPIGGGGGQISGPSFTMYDDGDVQYGLRLNERYCGPYYPNCAGVYEVKAGDSPGAAAPWNFDWHVNLGTHTYADYLNKGGLKFSVRRVGALSFGPIYSDLDILTPVARFGDQWFLFQESWNLGWPFWPWTPSGDDTWDATAPLVYELTLQLGDLCPVTVLASACGGSYCGAPP